MLVLLNVPPIGVWVKLLMIPYKYLYPSALFFVAIGVYSTNNDMFQVGETVVVGWSAICCCCSISTRPRSCSASSWGHAWKRTSAVRCWSRGATP